jgi:hypothetical protein
VFSPTHKGGTSEYITYKRHIMDKFFTLELKVSDLRMETIDIHGNGEAIELLVVLL